jgi:hypothetical protein
VANIINQFKGCKFFLIKSAINVEEHQKISIQPMRVLYDEILRGRKFAKTSDLLISCVLVISLQ